MNDKSSPWRNRREAGAYLGLSPKTIDELKRKGRLTPHYHGNRPIYHVKDLDKIPTRQPA